MKKENVFVTYMTFAGAVSGFLVTAILMAIAIPGYDNFLLTISEKHQFDMMAKAMGWVMFLNNNWIMISLFVLIAGTGWVLFLRVLNPNIGKGIFRPVPIAKLIIAVLIAFVAVPFLILLLKELLGIRSGVFSVISIGQPQSETGSIIKSIVFHSLVSYGLQFGLIWIIIGEKGWLGDLSSWKMPAGSTRRGNILTFASGTVVGLGMAVLLILQNWFFNKFFILVSEVLDKYGETSFLGFLYFLVELVILFGVFAFVFSGLAVALAPVERDAAYRKQKLIMPFTAFAVTIVLMLSIYGYASYRYDLNKESLAQAAGIPEKASESKVLIVMDSGKDRKTPLVYKWPLETSAWSFADDGTIAVSQENLQKVEKYLNDHPQGSVFQYAAQDALYKGYNTLGAIEKGLEYQYKASADMLLPRLQLIKRLSYLPVTKKNMEYLTTFTDETKWYVSGKYSHRLARALIHQNRFKEAKKWIDKAKEQNATVEKKDEATLPDGPVLTKGQISGALALNGTAPKGVRVMLFADEGYPVAQRMEYLDPAEILSDDMNASMGMRLVDQKETDETGRFSFEDLGEGEYSIVFVAAKSTVPDDISPDGIQVKNNPGVIKLESKKPKVDLGIIDISKKK